MNITPVDHNTNLFYIENLYPQELLDKLNESYILSLPWKKEDMQSDWLRRRLLSNETLEEADQYVKQRVNEIEQAINFKILSCDTGFWLDETGFTVNRHLDNSGVAASMQVYMWNNPALPGTTFYQGDNIRKEFKYKQNTGYVMINGANQWHGMTAKVPRNNCRLCSYTWFYPKV
jgi:hypothetical protein